MSHVRIVKIDEVFVAIDADTHIKEELREHFSFRPKNYQFNPKFKARIWDGYIRLYNPFANRLYLGLVGHVVEYCQRCNYTYDIDPGILVDQSVDKNYGYELGKRLKLPFPVRDYQNDYVVHMINSKRAVIQSPTASGKSLIAFLVAQHYKSKHALRTLVIVPTVSLVMQMRGDFIEYGGNENDIHIIKSGSDKNTNADFVFSTWQSIHRIKDSNWLNQFGVIIGDEAHLFQAKSLTNIMTKTTNVEYKFGMTGTIKSDEDQKVHKLVLEGLFGPVKKLIKTKDLIENGTLASINIKALVLDYSKKNRSELAAIKRKLTGENVKKKYQAEVTFVTENDKRNNFIKKLVWSLKDQNNLILFDKVEKHGKPLNEILGKDGRILHFVHGKINGDKREAIRHEVENDNTDSMIIHFGDKKYTFDKRHVFTLDKGKSIEAMDVTAGMMIMGHKVTKIDHVMLPNKRHDILASFGTFSTGVNIKRIDNIIFASGGRSEVKILQSIGRGLRKGNGSDSMTLYDIADDLTYGGNGNYLIEHFRKRIEIYQQEGHPFKIYQIPFEM